MIDEKELKLRLIQWADEYRGGLPSNGWPGRNFLATLIEHRGFVPGTRGFVPVAIHTAADEVEAAIMDMERGNYFKPGRVVRCEYFLINSPFDAKMQNLRDIGLPMSKAGYYLYLGQAHAYLAGALSRAAA